MPRHLPARHTTTLPPSFCPPATINATGIRVAATQIPDQWITDHSIVIEPGGGPTPNQIHLTLQVGDITIDDTAENIRSTTPL